MKYLKSINEYGRTVGFRYSAPKESYNIDILLKGDDITKDKINLGLSKVRELVYNQDSIEVNILEEGTIAELQDGPVEIDAIAHFNITVYNEKEIFSDILMYIFGINVQKHFR
jgi:hypothetical protein